MKLSEHQLVASICRESFYDFVKEFWEEIVPDTFLENWHIPFLCDELQVVAERVFAGKPKEHDLVINISPGSSKSTIVSQLFPAWVWTRMPAARFICGSYAQQVGLKDSLKTRDVVQCTRYQQTFPGLVLREDENTKGLFTNTRMGSRLAVSVGGFVTGYHAHFQIVDDPLNPEEAMSEAELRTTNRWMRTTLSTRKVDKQVTPLILIQQRLHQADPSGEVLMRGRITGKVRHICLPGEKTADVSPPEVVRHYDANGGLFDPVRMPRTVLNDLRSELGEYGYSAQVLQSPVPLGGGMFKVDKLHVVPDAPSKFVKRVRSWDKAGTEGGGAWSVGLDMGVDDKGRYWVLDVVRGQWGATEREVNIKETAKRDGLKMEVLVEVEGGSGGKESGETTAKNLAGFWVTLYHPTGDKVARAYGFASQVGGGNVYVLDRTWTRDYIEELRFFPNGRFKDQVDASSGAFNRIARKRKKLGAW